jgi:putative Mn2+ efflux pump MntP
MTILSIALIGVSLSVDAFAISVGAGISVKDLKVSHAIRASFFFGFFQFIMPVAGWHLGSVFASYIQSFDHWIAFGLLCFVGGKMIVETLRGSSGSSADVRNLASLLVLSFATSIDALAVGLSFSIMSMGIWLPAGIIGVITFAICLCGFEFGRRVGSILEKWAGIAGGLVLIGIGVKILVEHLMA